MDFRTLTYFVTVAEELNITQAAKRLSMSQPPLSNQIRDLEKDLDTQLFIRGSRGSRRLELTPTGELLLRRAQQILSLCEKTREEIHSYGKELSGNLMIGTVEGRAPFLIAWWIAGFQEEYPLVHYTLRSGGTDDILGQLFAHEIDLAVIATPYDNEHVEGFCVGTEPWVALLPKSHPLASDPGSEIPLSALCHEPLILPERVSRIEAITRWFESIGAEPQILCRLSNYQDAVALVEQSVGICIFPQTTYTPNPLVVTKLITDPPKAVKYALVTPKGQIPSTVTNTFIEYVKDVLEDELLHPEHTDSNHTNFSLPEDVTLL